MSRFASLAHCLQRRAFPSSLRRVLRRVALFVFGVPLVLACVQSSGQQLRREAQRHRLERRSVHGLSAAQAVHAAQAQHSAFGLKPRSQSFAQAWTPLGPVTVSSPGFGNLTGRVTSLAFDPNDATGNTVYLGTADGGVWKSSNATAAGNVRFTPLTDTLSVFSQSAGASVTPSLAIGALAVQPAATAVLLAGTGDPNDATDSLYGEGLLRSTDGGATWTLIETSQDGSNGKHAFLGLATAALAWSSASPSLVVAGFSTSAQGQLENAVTSISVPGLYYSTDAGVSWKMATVYDGATIIQTAQPLGSGSVGYPATSVVWDAQRGSFYAALRGHGYYSSTDGANWKRLTAQPGTGLTLSNCPSNATLAPAATCPLFRGTLAVQPATGDLYALSVDANNQDQGLWQDLCNASNGLCSNNAPSFATRLDGAQLEAGSGSTVIPQGDYNLSLAAVPTASNGTLLLAGTVDLYRCALAAGASSCTWRNTTNALNGCNAPAGVAPAQHALAVNVTAGSTLLLIGNDGGLWSSTDGVAETGSVCAATDSQHFQNLNSAIATGGSLAQVLSLAQASDLADSLMVGLGGNGAAMTEAASSLVAWSQLSTGESGAVAIDPSNSANRYAMVGAGIRWKACTLGSGCSAQQFGGTPTVGVDQTSKDVALYHAPAILDPAAPSNLITASCRIWRGPAADGSTWSSANALSTPVGASVASVCTSSNPMVRSLGAGGGASTSSLSQNTGSQQLYAGLAGALDGGGSQLGGHLFATSRADLATSMTAWNDLALNAVSNDSSNGYLFNPGQLDVSSVVVDTHDSTGKTVYATVMGFGGDLVLPHVYRSMDGGAHWLNLSANLPNAPVSALVVDPNDANTVYVATDAGVYATQAITSCSTAQCWNLLGTGLPNAPVTSLVAAAQLSTPDGRLGMLRAGTYGRGLWQTPLLAAVSNAQPAVALSSVLLDFGSVQVATQSGAQSVTVTNTGNAVLSVSSVQLTGDFTESDTCVGQSIAVNASCTLSVVFAPTITGSRTGGLTLYANISGGQATVALSGVGLAPAAVTLTPVALSFPATVVNQTAAAQIVTVANTGGSSATLGTPVLVGDFALAANTCTGSLTANTACALSITFTPTTSGTRNGSLSLSSSAGALTATLTGSGNAPATDTLSPASLSFGSQVLDSASNAQSVLLTNSGDAALTLITAASDSTEFAVTNGCGASLAGHSTCALSVVFAPNTIGSRSATLLVTDQFRSQSVALNGTGLAPAGVSVTPSALSFGEIGVGLSSAVQSVTLTNNGGSTLTLSGLTPSGDFVLVSNRCPTALPAGASCSVSLLFAPTQAGGRVGSLSVLDSVGTQTVALNGTGADFTLAADGTTTATLGGSSGTASYAVLLSSVSGLHSALAIGCTGAPAHALCAVTPSSATLGSNYVVTVVVSTGIAALSPAEQRPLWRRGAPLELACLLMFPLWKRRRSRLSGGLFLLPVLLCCVSGCGAGRVIPGDTGGSSSAAKTPAGVYTLTISASAAGLTRSVPLTLTVQ
ncbi:MAG: choice-of-anchor D domain-containing protein [Acidobacteriaceae bacterium]|nr:choice-of-anchor D domain-containing protein [Acidobacteriaceae bacterium]